MQREGRSAALGQQHLPRLAQREARGVVLPPQGPFERLFQEHRKNPAMATHILEQIAK
jgi:hypothetical protein